MSIFDGFYVIRVVPIPASETQEGVYALVVYSSCSRQPMFFPPRPDVKAERDGKDILQNVLGPTTTKYRSLWFDENATEEPYCSQFLNVFFCVLPIVAEPQKFGSGP
ncbi:hypothetical protein RSAG8_08975, partial [Rhizoctonia solani AG-8 WAC10335]